MSLWFSIYICIGMAGYITKYYGIAITTDAGGVLDVVLSLVASALLWPIAVALMLLVPDE